MIILSSLKSQRMGITFSVFKGYNIIFTDWDNNAHSLTVYEMRPTKHIPWPT